MKRVSVRAIIPFGDGVILIKRIRNAANGNLEYYAFPGGGVETGET